MSKPSPPTIPGSEKLKTLEVEDLSLRGNLFDIHDAEDNNLIAYQESTNSWIPRTVAPVIIQTTVGVIRNISTGTQWIRWGQNTDGTADTFLLPDGGSYVGFTFSFNDTTAIDTGADPDSTWTVQIGRVYEGTEDVIDCANSATNFNMFDSYTLTKADVDAGNGFPQITNRATTMAFTGTTRISARSTSSGSWDFHNGDLIVNVYFAVNTLMYQ